MFRKGKQNMGYGKRISKLTDHERINIDPSELSRIDKAMDYYRDDDKNVTFYSVTNQKRQRKRYSLAVTKEVVQKLASLTINEGVTVSIQPSKDAEVDEDTGENELDKYIKEVLAENSFNQVYEEFLEMGLAAGGFAIRPYIENNKVRLSWIRADQFIPLKTNTNRIDGAVIVSRRTATENGETIYYSLLEFHEYDEVSESETVTYEAYRSDKANEIGSEVSLSKWDEELSEVVVFENISRPTFAYFKTPARNNKDVESPLGIGILENSYDTIDALNQTYDQYVREVRLSKRKILVPAQMLKPVAPQEGDSLNDPAVAFDEDEDLYTGLTETPTQNGGFAITNLEASLRVPQYTGALTSLFHMLENQIGMSQGTLTNDAKIADKTATEVVSDNSQTYRTRSSIVTQVEKQLYGLIRTIIELSAKPELFDDGQAPIKYDAKNNPIDINLHFEDGVFVDKDAKAEKEMKYVQAGLMPRVEFVKSTFGLSDDDAEQWIAQVDAENAGMDEPTLVLGGDDE